MDDIRWNIEIKYRKEWEGQFCPERGEYLDVFYQLVKDYGLEKRVILQCFDAELLRMAQTRDENVALSFLVYNLKGIKKNLEALGFIPEYYSPHFRLVKKKTLKVAKEKGVKLAVWTVNDWRDLEKMHDLGVDAIISDYPDRYLRLLQDKQR